MRNIKASVKGKILTIEIDITAPGVDSQSGKTLVVATTEGNTSVDGLSADFKLGVNFYKNKPKA